MIYIFSATILRLYGGSIFGRPTPSCGHHVSGQADVRRTVIAEKQRGVIFGNIEIFYQALCQVLLGRRFSHPETFERPGAWEGGINNLEKKIEDRGKGEVQHWKNVGGGGGGGGGGFEKCQMCRYAGGGRGAVEWWSVGSRYQSKGQAKRRSMGVAREFIEL